MTHRIAIGELSHETNCFAIGLTTIDDFNSGYHLNGQQIIRAHGGTRTYLGGMIDQASARGSIVLPTMAALAVPSGIIAESAFQTLLRELLRGIEAARPDAVCLTLHGAGVSEGTDDLEGAVLRRVRQLVGPRVPIAAALDLHGTVKPLMVQNSDGLFGVNYYPHTDEYERGGEALQFLVDLLGGRVQPAVHLEHLPMVIPPSSTEADPAKRLMELCFEWEEMPNLVDCSIFHGFPGSDIPAAGASVVAMANGDPRLAQKAAASVAAALWESREDFIVPTHTPEEAITLALEMFAGPIVINETSDNPGGGTPGDGTHTLRAMLDSGLTNTCFGVICDPDVAKQAHVAGVGSVINIRLGAKADHLYGTPILAAATIRSLSDGRFRYAGPMLQGFADDLGPMACLRIAGVDVVVSSKRSQVIDGEPFAINGVDVRTYRIVGLKSNHHFRAWYKNIATAIVSTDPPGGSSVQVETHPYTRIQRPIWPLDKSTVYGSRLVDTRTHTDRGAQNPNQQHARNEEPGGSVRGYMGPRSDTSI
ncbi:MAG: M81 family metallopeptidase [Aggregatilineales bacterium]